MGGPIKEGVMHGIREPKRNGGLSKQFNTGLVGDERYPKTDGREHHLAFLAPMGMAALRFGPAALRGFRAARAYKPWSENLGWAKRAKDIFKPSAGLGAPMAARGEGAGFRVGSLLRSNPIMALSLAPQAGVAGFKGAKYLTTEAAPAAGKAYVDALVPGESIFKEKTIEENIDPSNIKRAQGVPGGGDPKMKGDGSYDSAKKTELAKAAKEKRINSLLETMGYDKAKKNAAYDALIDASKIITDRGNLKGDVTGEVINPIIQATSKRLDKPEQIREAVGLMQTKADIEAEMNKEKNKLDNRYKNMQILAAQKTLSGGTIQEAVLEQTLKQGGSPTGSTLSSIARAKGLDTKVLPIKIPKNTDTLDHITEVIKQTWKDPEIDRVEPGAYVIKDRIIIVDEAGNIKPYL